MLEKHLWYANQWQARFEDVPVADHALVLFIQAPGGPTISESGTGNTTMALHQLAV